MTHITYRLTVKNRDQLQNPTLCKRVWATFTFLVFFGATAAAEARSGGKSASMVLPSLSPFFRFPRGRRDEIELDDLCDKLQRSSVGARRYYQLS